MEDEINIGPKLKAVREKKGLTLKQLAAISGLSIGFISQIEREQVDPSWASLKKITAALNIKLKDLFDEEAKPFAIVRKGQGYQVELHNIRREFLAAIDNASMEMVLTLFPPHSASGAIAGHAGEEFIWVIRGSLTITVDAATHSLHAGDSIYFRSDQPHSWRNETSEPCQVLWIDTPPLHI